MKKTLFIFPLILFSFMLFISCENNKEDNKEDEETVDNDEADEICKVTEEFLNNADEFIEFVEDEVKEDNYLDIEYLSRSDRREAEDMLEGLEELADEIAEILEEEDISFRRKSGERKAKKFFKECECEDLWDDYANLNSVEDLEWAADVTLTDPDDY